MMDKGAAAIDVRSPKRDQAPQSGMAERTATAFETALWDRVGDLADRAPTLADLRHHRLHLLAATRMRRRGLEVPGELRLDESRAAAVTISAAPLLRRIRVATDAPMLIMKGPEAAAFWPEPRLRPWKDLDLYAEDAPAVQAALLDAGFTELGPPLDYGDSHHLRPLAFPSVPIAVEVHRRPKWPSARAPSFGELAEAALPSTVGVPGFLAPGLAHHAVLLAAHAWEHDPLGRVGSLADIAALLPEADLDAIDAIARAWGVARLWGATARALDRLLLSPRRRRTPIWHRHLYETRERTVFEGHVERLVGAVAAAPAAAAPLAAARAISRTLRPWPGETWSQKLQRSRQSMQNASLRESDHSRELFGRDDT
jgi:hypothetical protein